MYVSTKTYSAERGLSCAFRQWRADSHCNRVHGYALGFHLEFASLTLDARNWCVDFGGLKDLKGMLDDTFDHTLLVAADDPHKEYIMGLQERGLAKVIEVEATGCEATAKLVFEVVEQYIKDAGYGSRVKVMSVEVREHGANSAKFLNPEFLFGRHPWASAIQEENRRAFDRARGALLRASLESGAGAHGPIAGATASASSTNAKASETAAPPEHDTSL